MPRAMKPSLLLLHLELLVVLFLECLRGLALSSLALRAFLCCGKAGVVGIHV